MRLTTSCMHTVRISVGCRIFRACHLCHLVHTLVKAALCGESTTTMPFIQTCDHSGARLICIHVDGSSADSLIHSQSKTPAWCRRRSLAPLRAHSVEIARRRKRKCPPECCYHPGRGFPVAGSINALDGGEAGPCPGPLGSRCALEPPFSAMLHALSTTLADCTPPNA